MVFTTLFRGQVYVLIANLNPGPCLLLHSLAVVSLSQGTLIRVSRSGVSVHAPAGHVLIFFSLDPVLGYHEYKIVCHAHWGIYPTIRQV